VNHQYEVAVLSSSSDPHDWGPAMAAATTQLAELVQTDDGPALRDLFRQDRHLTITETDDGVRVGLGWDPPGGGTPAADAH
jgi:hypothetical protein